MATYRCDKCDMQVNASCGHCDAPLENGMLALPDGKEVPVSYTHLPLPTSDLV